MKFSLSKLTVGAMYLITVCTSPAQTAPKFKMTTELPPGIASADQVETRLGTLKFFDGFPDDAKVSKL